MQDCAWSPGFLLETLYIAPPLSLSLRYTVPAANTLPSFEVVLEKAEYVPIPATVPTMPTTRTDSRALRVLLLTGAPFTEPVRQRKTANLSLISVRTAR